MIVKKYQSDERDYYYLIGSEQRVFFLWDESHGMRNLSFIDRDDWAWKDKFIKNVDCEKFIINHGQEIIRAVLK